MAAPTPSFTSLGAYLRAKRKAARFSVRSAAEALGLSHELLSRIERDKLPLLAKHWPAVVKVIPGVTLAELDRYAALSQPVEIDVSAHPEYADLVVALKQRVRAGDLAATSMPALLAELTAGTASRVRAHGRVIDAAGQPVTGHAFLYRLGTSRGWVGLVGVRAHAAKSAGPFDGRLAALTDKQLDLLRPGDARGAGFFDVPGGLPLGDYALDVHLADGRQEWAWPLTVSDGVASQDVRLGGPAAARTGTSPTDSTPPSSPGGKPPSPGSIPIPTNLPPVAPLARQLTKGTFTASFSYYGLGGAPLDRIFRDLDRIRAAGFGNVRVWVDWERPSPASRIIDRKGALIAAQAAKLDAALDRGVALGLGFDLTLETAHYDAVKKSEEGYDIGAHKAALRALLERWGRYPALRIVDVDNEAEVRGAGGHGSPDTGHTSPARFNDLMGVARSVPRTCLVGASCSFSIDGLPKDYANLFRDTKGEILLPHFPRVKGWGAAEGPNAKALAKAIPGVLIHHQEPARNGHSTSPPEGWPLAEFEASFRSAKAAGSVGCCLHSDAAFDLTQKDAWDQLDATEREAIAHLRDWLE